MTLVSTYNKESWCQFPTILDNTAFWEGAKEVLTRDADSLSKSKENFIEILLSLHFYILYECLLITFYLGNFFE